jgi:hypothetical protein
MLVEDIAFFIYRLSRWVNSIVIFVIRIFKKNVTRYYLVTSNGTPLPLTPLNYALMQPSTLLVIYYTPTMTKYRMLSIESDDYAEEAVEEIRSAYSECEVPSYAFIGMSVKVGEKTHELPAHEFMVAGSTLFSPVFNKWLCKHYLHVEPGEVEATFIDDLIRMVAVTSEVVLSRDKYVIKQI